MGENYGIIKVRWHKKHWCWLNCS